MARVVTQLRDRIDAASQTAAERALALVATAPALGAIDTVQAGEVEVDTGDDVYDRDEDDVSGAEQSYRLYLPAVSQ